MADAKQLQSDLQFNILPAIDGNFRSLKQALAELEARVSTDARSLNETVDQVRKRAESSPVEIKDGEIRRRQANGEWSPWTKIASAGGGGLSRSAVQKIVDDAVALIVDSDDQTASEVGADDSASSLTFSDVQEALEANEAAHWTGATDSNTVLNSSAGGFTNLNIESPDGSIDVSLTTDANGPSFELQVAGGGGSASFVAAQLSADSGNGQTFGTNVEAVEFVTEEFDLDGGILDVATNPTRVVVPAGASYIRLTAACHFGGLPTAADISACFRRNGTDVDFVGNAAQCMEYGGSTSNGGVTVSTPPFAATPGDYFEIVLDSTDIGYNLSGLRTSTFTLEVIA